MSGKTLKEIKEQVLEKYKKDFPGENLYGKVFSIYILDRYTRLLYRIYKKSTEK